LDGDGEERRAQNVKKRTLGLIVLGVVGVPVVLGARALLTRGQDPQGARELVMVERRDIGSSVIATGIVRPMVGAEVRVGSRISGIVESLPVKIGDQVRKGQILAELDASELEARRDQAVASTGLARANLSYALADLDRKRGLARDQLISPSELDLAERAAAVAEQQLEEAEANLQYARTQLGYTRIQAPISGVVASVSTQEGETVAASLASPTFVTIIDLDRLEIWAYVDETDIGRIEEGQQARFTVDTYPDTEFEGRVEAIYPQAEIQDSVVNYVTVIAFETKPGRKLRPEMTTSVRVALETRENVLAVPRRAVRRERGRKFVYLPRGDRLEKQWVSTGWRDGSYWEIVDGLEEGNEVVVGDVTAEATPAG
jgi:RND family efflux transporter MFP subunit